MKIETFAPSYIMTLLWEDQSWSTANCLISIAWVCNMLTNVSCNPLSLYLPGPGARCTITRKQEGSNAREVDIQGTKKTWSNITLNRHMFCLYKFQLVTFVGMQFSSSCMIYDILWYKCTHVACVRYSRCKCKRCIFTYCDFSTGVWKKIEAK